MTGSQGSSPPPLSPACEVSLLLPWAPDGGLTEARPLRVISSEGAQGPAVGLLCPHPGRRFSEKEERWQEASSWKMPFSVCPATEGEGGRGLAWGGARFPAPWVAGAVSDKPWQTGVLVGPAAF